MWKQLFAGSLVLALALSRSEPAQSAWYARQHASACFGGPPAGEASSVQAADTGNGHGIRNVFDSLSSDFVCPFPDSTATPKEELTYAWLKVYRPSGAPVTTAKACRQQAGVQSAVCSAAASTTGTGYQSINLFDMRGGWYGDSAFAYTYVSLGGKSQLYGILYGYNW
jgi:hypothetical protein